MTLQKENKYRNIMEKESAKKSKGVYLVNKGVQIATRPTWTFQGVPTEGGALWWKQPSSPGRAGRQPPPSFPL